MQNFLNTFLAENYYKIGDYPTAKLYFQQARNMIPSRIIPNYGLYKTALAIHSDDAEPYAKQVLSNCLKVETLTSVLIKAECRNYLDSLNHVK